MHNKTRIPDASGWHILSFFHDDEALKNTGVLVAPNIPIDPQILFESKYKDIERMSNYSFIKKIIIPYNHQITIENLNFLIDTF